MWKYAERYKKWQKNVPLVSPFVVGCGVVAALYFFSRIVLIVSPALVLEQTAFKPADSGSIVCSEEEDGQLADPQPILSTSYQKRIHEARGLGPNLVKNPDLRDITAGTSQPTGYTHSIENRTSHYDFLEDNHDRRFLRTKVTKDPAKNTVPPAWQISPVAVRPHHTYAYSFWYRSNTPVKVSLEYIANRKTKYAEVTTLQATATWQQFAAHFSNEDNAASLRFDLNGSGAAQTDTRSFDIHEIQDARLGTGIVSVAFDDGWQSVKDHALALLNKYQIRTTQYIITDVAAQAVRGYMDFNTLKMLRSTGQEIGSHSLRHCNQTMLKPADLEMTATSSKQTLERQQLGPIKSFAYPLGQYDSKTQAVYEKQYPLIRTSDFGYNDRYFDETNIHSIAILSTTTDAEFKSWLNQAKQHRMWVVLVYHNVDAPGEYSVTSTQLEKQLQMIKASGLRTLPLSEAASSIRR